MLNLFSRLLRSAALSSDLRLRDRAILLAWAAACWLTPQTHQRSLVLWRFAPTSPTGNNYEAAKSPQFTPLVAPSWSCLKASPVLRQAVAE